MEITKENLLKAFDFIRLTENCMNNAQKRFDSNDDKRDEDLAIMYRSGYVDMLILINKLGLDEEYLDFVVEKMREECDVAASIL